MEHNAYPGPNTILTSTPLMMTPILMALIINIAEIQGKLSQLMDCGTISDIFHNPCLVKISFFMNLLEGKVMVTQTTTLLPGVKYLKKVMITW